MREAAALELMRAIAGMARNTTSRAICCNRNAWHLRAFLLQRSCASPAAPLYVAAAREEAVAWRRHLRSLALETADHIAAHATGRRFQSLSQQPTLAVSPTNSRITAHTAAHLRTHRACMHLLLSATSPEPPWHIAHSLLGQHLARLRTFLAAISTSPRQNQHHLPYQPVDRWHGALLRAALTHLHLPLPQPAAHKHTPSRAR